MTGVEDFPSGTYVSVLGSVRADAGGQTSVMLLRQRLLGDLGIDVPILTFDARTDYRRVRADLRRAGRLGEQHQLLNLHEDLATRDLSPLPEVEAPAPGAEPLTEHRRADGTVYARIPPQGTPEAHLVLDHAGRLVAAPTSLGGLWRWWVQLVTAGSDRVFVLSDSRHVAQQLSVVDDPHFFVLHQVHNPHTVGDRRWDAPIARTYQGMTRTFGRLDALCLLTERQRDDLALRFGAAEHLEVIGNPVAPAPVPDPVPERRPGRVVVIARLTGQKRVDLAVDAFAVLARDHPDAVLDVYGEGEDRAALQARIDAAGLASRAVLHGYRPDAAEELWSADVAWVTSDYEGFPLFVLEARSRGCPVVSFDIRYGPREQIRDGVDGALVPPGDVAGLARRTGELLADRARLERMREKAREGVQAHGPDRFLADWAAVLHRAVERKPHRTRIRSVQGDPTVSTDAGTTRLDARLVLAGRGDLDRVRLRWQAWTPTSEAPSDLPLRIDRDGGTFTLAGEVAHPDLPGDDTVAVHSRLLLEWGNSTWQQSLADLSPRPGRPGPGRWAGAVRRRLRHLTD